MGTQVITVAFDVDGTLVSWHETEEMQSGGGYGYDVPNDAAINLLKAFKQLGCRIIVWSGSGEDYARMWVKRLWLEPHVDVVTAKPPAGECVHIAVDDCEVDFGKVNLRIPE